MIDFVQLSKLTDELSALDAAGLTRKRKRLDSPCCPTLTHDGREIVSFASNDYLGLANHPALIEAAVQGAQTWGVGSGASHLVSGHMRPHELLEEALAAFVASERALLFSTGYMANLGIVTSLVGRGDAIFADRLNHASLIDAVRLSGAESYRYKHLDMAMLERQLSENAVKYRSKRKLIVTDAVFSMDGDLAILPALYALAERFDAWLLVDDAHGFGVLGKNGRGTCSHVDLPIGERLIFMGTLGKAAGVSGAFVAGDARVVELLIQRARSYIFTTGSSPILACALLASLKLIAEDEQKRVHLQTLAARLKSDLANTPWKLLPSLTAIQPILIGENHETLRIANALFERGLWVPAIRPPTVPAGSARLRVCLSAAHTEAHVDLLINALREIA